MTERANAHIGLLKSPFPVERCAAEDCQAVLTDETGAYLFRDLHKTGDKGYLVVFCTDCAIDVELHNGDRFMLIAL